jgi:hypothetical protein
MYAFIRGRVYVPSSQGRHCCTEACYVGWFTDPNPDKGLLPRGRHAQSAKCRQMSPEVPAGIAQSTRGKPPPRAAVTAAVQRTRNRDI